MKHIAFVVGSFYPDFSAVGYCAYQVQKCLMDEFAISVLAQRSERAQPLEEDLGGIKIRRVETDYTARRNALKARPGQAARGRLRLLRAWGGVKRLLTPETIDHALVDTYLRGLEGMDLPPSAIVPLVFPFESVLAALVYKKANPDVAVLPYLFDDFVDSGSLHVLKIARRLKRARHLRLERRMLEEADAVLAMHPLREHFGRHFEKTLIDKITFLEHPLLVRSTETAQRPGDDSVRLCFTGSLIKKVRTPDYLLSLLRAVRSKVLIRVDFYVMGNAAAKVRTESVGESIKIVNHGRVAKSEADVALRNANILINLGEVRGRQVSSKIFEYMATGKPIIHLACVGDDVVSKILSKYPLALCLIESPQQLDSNARLLCKFIEENKARSLNFVQVAALYPEALPSATADTFKSLLSQQGN